MACRMQPTNGRCHDHLATRLRSPPAQRSSRRWPTRKPQPPKRHRTKVQCAAVGSTVKSSLITSPDVLTHFWPGLKNRLKGLTFAETPLARSPDSLGAPRLPKRGGCSPREEVSSFRADLGHQPQVKRPLGTTG